MSEPIRIAIASGKGGTGKTTLATNLAVVLAESGEDVAYVDCDVEEPNGHLFLAPIIRTSHAVSIPVPEVDASRCTFCGACARTCRYSAIAALPGKILTFPKLCHGCGGCGYVCPRGAIREVPRTTGVVEEGFAGQVAFVQGRLEVGEAMAPPVIRAALASAPRDRTLVLDAPPGTSCPVIASVETADIVLLVTEPTPFGRNDLALAVSLVRALGLPFGVAINRAGSGYGGVSAYCEEEGIPVLLEIPNDRAIAQSYARGQLAIHAVPTLKPLLLELHAKLERLARGPRLPLQQAAPPLQPAQEPARLADPAPETVVQIGAVTEIPELVVVSGKGGTGKTSIAASLFALAGEAAVADCDVDAADLHLVLDPAIVRREPFSGAEKAAIDPERCLGCGACAIRCRFGAILPPAGDPEPAYRINPIACEGCGVCAEVCPTGAVFFVPTAGGERFQSETRFGPMTHARLGVAQENSGKLVSLVRRGAKAVAASKQRRLLICDGSPGIGCPVIASITGARLALVVTEPTPSGLHDFGRIAELCRRLEVAAGICINKADLNPELSDRLEAEAANRGIPVLGRIRYDDSVTTAQVRRVTVVESGGGPAALDIRALWSRIEKAMARARSRPAQRGSPNDE
jgi:MinD superfamily P-loop ATPase